MGDVERPTTSRGLRSRARRPPSRGGRQIEHLIDDETEENGRPGSRRGFTPETYDREDYDEFSRQNHVIERQITPEYESPLNLMSGHMSPRQQRNSPAFRDSPYSQKGYRPHRDSPLVYSPTNHESPHDTPFERPSSRRKGDVPYSDRMYSSDSPQHDDHRYGSSPADRHYSSSSNYEHHDHGYGDQNIYNNNMGFEFDQRTNSPEMESNVLCVDDSWHQTPREKPPTARPKSSRKRLKSSRKKRQEQESQQTYSAVDTPILRPPSSLSKYKPLPAIGATSPTTDDTDDISKKAQVMTLGLGERTRTSYSIELHKKDSENPSEHFTSRDSDRRESIDQNLRDRRESLEQHNTSYRQQSLEQHDASYRRQSIEQHDTSYSRRQSLEQHDTNYSRRQSLEHPDSAKEVDLSKKNGFQPHDLPREPDEAEVRILLAIRLPDGRRHQRYFRLVEKMDLVLKFAENVSGMDLAEYRLACNAPRAVFTDLTQLVGESGIQDRTILYLEEME